MAFVIKTTKGLEFKQSETKDIGPGEYLAQTNIKTIERAKAPFLVKVPKGDNKDNNVPGPGTYYQDETLLNYLRNIHNEKQLARNDKDQVLVTKGNASITLKHNVEKLGFNQKEKRFKPLKPSNPGPGCYFPSVSLTTNKLFQSQNRVISERKRLKELMLLKQESSIPSIPVFNQAYGFDISSNGALIRKPNPEMYRTFSGEKGDTVGPGSYELNYPSRWLQSGAEWSKDKTARQSNERKSKEEMNKTKQQLLDLQGLSLRTTVCSESKPRADHTHLSFFKCKMAKGKENTSTGDRSQKNIFNPRISQTTQKVNHINSPGPGYYFEFDKLSSFKAKRCPEYKQFFGSKMTKFQKDNSNPLTSPVSYFTDDERLIARKALKEKSITTNVAFSTKTDRFFHSEPKETKPGPGQYNNMDLFYIKLDEDVSKFGSEKRFSQTSRELKEKYGTPGPGSYFNFIQPSSNFKWKGILNHIDKTKEYLKDCGSPLLHNAKSSCNVVNSNSPPVGNYNPETVFTIDYKIKKKKNVNLSGDIAFNSGISRVRKQKVEKADIGPGYYYKEKRSLPQQISPPFNRSDLRKMGEISPTDKLKPGDYNIDSYYNWNKKTFNINYI